MGHPSNDPPVPDSGLACLALAARFHGVPCDPALLRHRLALGSAPLDAPALLRAARALGLEARLCERGSRGPGGLALPLLAECRDGTWRLLARLAGERALVFPGGATAPLVLGLPDFLALWTGRVLLLGAAGPRGGPVAAGIGWLLGTARPPRRLVLEILAASVALQVLGLAAPLFFQVVVDKVLVHRVVGTLQVLVSGFVLVALFEALGGALRANLLARVVHRMDAVLGERLFEHLLSLPLAWFEARRVGDVVAHVRELETLRAFVTGAALTLLLDLLFTAAVFALLVAYSPALALVVACSLPLYAALSLAAAPVLRQRAEERLRLGAENHALLVEALSGVHTLKSLALEPVFAQRWAHRIGAHAEAGERAAVTAGWSVQAAALVNRLVAAALLWFGAGAVMRGALSVGELVAFNLLAMRVGAPLLRLFQMWQEFQQARLAAERLSDILRAPPEGAGAGCALPRIAGAVRFERTSFRYPGSGAPALEDLELEIRAGEVLGIAGPSGSGKSTLVRLLQRLHPPERGRVLVDGVDLAVVAPESLRRQLAVVPQECFLFDASVRENIAPGDAGVPLERIVRAATLAGAHEFVLALPQAYETRLGEQARMLSGGQRQRIALARALLREPRILVLDEATSALDYESEAAIARNLGAIAAGRTVLIVAHRLSALARCDRVAVLDRGRLAECGPPAELLRRGGLYARLHAQQEAA